MTDGLLVRYADLIPDSAYRSPAAAADQLEFSIVGGGVGAAEAELRRMPGALPMTVAGVRQAFGGVATARLRDTAEAFIVHAGRWRLALGPNGEGDSLELAPGDVVSVPAGAYRTLNRLDLEPGFLFVVRGGGGGDGDGDGPVPAVPAMFAAAETREAQLLEGGRWIDCSGGMPVLREAPREAATGRPSGSSAPARAGVLSECAVAAACLTAQPDSPLAAHGVEEAAVIAPRASRDGFGPGPIRGWWPHGFSLRRLALESGAYVARHSRAESQIFVLHEGTLEVNWGTSQILMGAGDTLLVPGGVVHALRNTTSRRTTVFVVRGSEDPALPVFHSLPSHP